MDKTKEEFVNQAKGGFFMIQKEQATNVSHKNNPSLGDISYNALEAKEAFFALQELCYFINRGEYNEHYKDALNIAACALYEQADGMLDKIILAAKELKGKEKVSA